MNLGRFRKFHHLAAANVPVVPSDSSIDAPCAPAMCRHVPAAHLAHILGLGLCSKCSNTTRVKLDYPLHRQMTLYNYAHHRTKILHTFWHGWKCKRNRGKYFLKYLKVTFERLYFVFYARIKFYNKNNYQRYLPYWLLSNIWG